MAYLNLDLGFHRHPKVKRLVGLLGRGAEVLLTRLWCHCGEHHCVTGMLTGYSGQEIESIIEWWGKPGSAVDALVRVGFLIEQADGYAVKDWLEHSGHLAAHKEWSRTSNEKRWRNRRTGVVYDPTGSPSGSPTGNPLQDSQLVSSKDSLIPKDSSSLEGPQKKSNEADSAWLARIWLFHHAGGHSDFDRESAGNFADLLAAGVTKEAIEAEIKRADRPKAEPIWDFCKRLMPGKRGQNGKPGGHLGPGRVPVDQAALDQNARRRAAQKDRSDKLAAENPSAEPRPRTGTDPAGTPKSDP